MLYDSNLCTSIAGKSQDCANSVLVSTQQHHMASNNSPHSVVLTCFMVTTAHNKMEKWNPPSLDLYLTQYHMKRTRRWNKEVQDIKYMWLWQCYLLISLKFQLFILASPPRLWWNYTAFPLHINPQIAPKITRVYNLVFKYLSKVTNDIIIPTI